MALGHAEQIGGGLCSRSAHGMAGQAVLFNKQLLAILRAGNQANAGEVAPHLFVGERKHVVGKVARLLFGEMEVGHRGAGRDRIGSQEVAFKPVG